MLCNNVQDRLKAYIDGGMATEQRRAVEAHLQSCADCRGALKRNDRLAAVLLEAKPPPVPSGFASRVMLATKSRQRVTSVPAGNCRRSQFATHLRHSIGSQRRLAGRSPKAHAAQ